MSESNEFLVVARTPDEMAVAGREIAAFAEREGQAAAIDLADMEKNLAIAIEHKWRTSGLVLAVRTARRKVVYYEKLKAAAEAGYYVVPNMPVDIFAIRTEKGLPGGQWTEDWRSAGRVESDSPPVGLGDYKSSVARVDRHENRIDNKVVSVQRRAVEYQDWDFPFKFAKPEVLNDVTKAMALKVFDEIGILPARPAQQAAVRGSTMSNKWDPMVIGQIVCKLSRYTERRVSFLISWWLAEEHLKA